MNPPSTKHRQLARSAGVFTGATLLSRILGYARDSLVANFFGAGIAADAFYAAFRISNLLRRALGEGALSASFIPIFSEYSAKHSHQKTQEFLNSVFTKLLTILIVVTVLGIVFAPEVTRLIAMGFEKTPERFALTVTLTRYMFPFLLFVSLAALLSGVLNALGVFFVPALAPASLSLIEIGYLLALAPSLSPDQQVVGLAMAVAIGGLGQLVINFPALWKKGFSLRWNWNPQHEGLRRVGKLMVPATVGISVDQVNTFVDTLCASFLATGAVTALYYANRVMQLPLALFGIALSQVALPSMSASVAKGDVREVKDTLNFALRLTLFMILPATTGLLLLGHPIVKVLFEHGLFGPEATRLTNGALLFFSIGLLAYASVKILASAFYAYQETRIPVTIAAGCVILNIVLNAYFIKFTTMGVGGLALSTSVASWVNMLALYLMLRRKIGLLGGRRILRTCAKSLIACASLGVVSIFMIRLEFSFPLFIRLLFAILLGSAAYLGTARLLRMEEWNPFWAQLSRRRTGSPEEPAL